MDAKIICVGIYVIIIIALLIALYLVVKFIPNTEMDKEVAKLDYLLEAVKKFKYFFLPIICNSICNVANNFSVTMFAPGIILYTIDE